MKSQLRFICSATLHQASRTMFLALGSERPSDRLPDAPVLFDQRSRSKPATSAESKQPQIPFKSHICFFDEIHLEIH